LSHCTLSLILGCQFEHCNDVKVIEEAVILQRLGLQQLSKAGPSTKHCHLRCLAQMMRHQHDLGVCHEDDDLLFFMLEVLRICPSMHTNRWTLYSALIFMLNWKYFYSQKLKYLNRRIELGHQVLITGNFPSVRRWANFLQQLAKVYQTCYKFAWENEDNLEESAELFWKSLQISLPRDVNHWACVQGLAKILVLQFCMNGNMDHLEEADQLYHCATKTILQASTWQPNILFGFARSLGLHFRETGDISRLNNAIDLDEEALAIFHPSSIWHKETNLQLVYHLCL
jgi:hypothetical protein